MSARFLWPHFDSYITTPPNRTGPIDWIVVHNGVLVTRPNLLPLPGFSPPIESRSRNMAAIKSANTKPEFYVRQALHAAGFRFRLHRRDIPGSPDIVLPRHKIAVLVHGCFWHGHRCRIDHQPRSNTSYWSAKIARNVERDARNLKSLQESGWRTVVIWECSLAKETAHLLVQLTDGCDRLEQGAQSANVL